MDVYMDDVRKCPPGWTLARTVAETKAFLETGTVEHLSLDHDMGACEPCVAMNKHIGDMLSSEQCFFQWCPHVEDGTSLARWIVETGNWPFRMPTVHSANPVGRERMHGIFRQYWLSRTEYWPDLPNRKVVGQISDTK